MGDQLKLISELNSEPTRADRSVMAAIRSSMSPNEQTAFDKAVAKVVENTGKKRGHTARWLWEVLNKAGGYEVSYSTVYLYIVQAREEQS